MLISKLDILYGQGINTVRFKSTILDPKFFRNFIPIYSKGFFASYICQKCILSVHSVIQSLYTGPVESKYGCDAFDVCEKWLDNSLKCVCDCKGEFAFWIQKFDE